MKSDLVIFTHTAIDYDSRIIRQAKHFAEEYHVILYARLLDEKSLEMFSNCDIEFVEIPEFLVSKVSVSLLTVFLKDNNERSLKGEIRKIIKRKIRVNYKFTDLYYMFALNNPWCRRKIKERYKGDYSNIAAVVVNDITLLHAAGRTKKEFEKEGYDIPLVCDLHESFFKFQTGASFPPYLAIELVQRNLVLADIMCAPSAGILKSYFDTKIKFKKALKHKAVHNTASFEELSPRKKSEKTKLVHIGGASSVRKLEKMIEALSYLSDEYELFFHLITTHSLVASLYIEELKNYAEKIKVSERVHFLDPVGPEELVRYINRYDIGVFYLEPNKGHKKTDYYTAPNKLFQYIQARLALVVTDIGEMGKVVKKYDVGTVSSFSVENFSKKIVEANDLLDKYKANSDKAAVELSANNQWKEISKYIKEYNN